MQKCIPPNILIFAAIEKRSGQLLLANKKEGEKGDGAEKKVLELFGCFFFRTRS